MEKAFDKRILIGAAAALAAVIVFFALTAAFLSKGWLTLDSQVPAICLSYGIAALLGGMIAARGKGKRLQRCLLVCAMLYALIWIAALSSGQAVRFLPEGAWFTAALIGGSIVAALAAPTSSKKGKVPKRTTNTSAKRRKKPVT